MTIRIGIDGRAMGGNVRDGLSNVSCNYFLHFPETEDVEFVVFSPHQNLFPEIAHCRSYKLVGASGVRKGWFYTKLPFLLQKHPVDVFWSPLQTLPFGIPKHIKTAVTIHDFAYLKYPETMPALRRWNLKFLAAHTVKRADLLVAISNTTAKDLAILYGGSEKTVVIYNGVDQEIFFPEKTLSPVLRDKGLESRRYFLVVGSLEPRKNLGIIFDAALKFLKDIPKGERPKFVFVYGNAWRSKELEKKIKEGILVKGDSIAMKGISSELLRNLYSHALALVFPSLYEGFGLPILEAIACGCPVIASDIESSREICRGVCFLVDRQDVSGFSDSFYRIERSRYSAKVTIPLSACFNWDRSASILIKKIKSLISIKYDRVD